MFGQMVTLSPFISVILFVGDVFAPFPVTTEKLRSVGMGSNSGPTCTISTNRHAAFAAYCAFGVMMATRIGIGLMTDDYRLETVLQQMLQQRPYAFAAANKTTFYSPIGNLGGSSQ